MAVPLALTLGAVLALALTGARAARARRGAAGAGRRGARRARGAGACPDAALLVSFSPLALNLAGRAPPHAA